MRLSKTELHEYKSVLNYNGDRYMSLVSVDYKTHRDWHRHFDTSVDPVYLENGDTKIPFYRTKGVIANVTPTNIMFALTPRAYDRAVEKLNTKAPAMTPDVPLRHAERELNVVANIKKSTEDAEVVIYRCNKTEFLRAYQEGTFRTTVDGGEVVEFEMDPQGVFWATAADKRFLLCSQRVASLLMEDMTIKEYMDERHGVDSRCDTCGSDPGSLKICAGCKVAHYCSKQCQVIDRKKHRTFCSSYN